MSDGDWLDQETLEQVIDSTRYRIRSLDWRSSEEERYLWVITLDLLFDLKEAFREDDRDRVEQLGREFEGLMNELVRFGSS